MTRDSNLWWWVMGASLVTAVSSKLELIDALVPENYHKQVHAVIELLALLAGIGAGVARMSPLSISAEGRADAIQKNVARADTASVAAGVAAVAADTAAKASTVAVEAATIAAEESTKAADMKDE